MKQKEIENEELKGKFRLFIRKDECSNVHVYFSKTNSSRKKIRAHENGKGSLRVQCGL